MPNPVGNYCRQCGTRLLPDGTPAAAKRTRRCAACERFTAAARQRLTADGRRWIMTRLALAVAALVALFGWAFWTTAPRPPAVAARADDARPIPLPPVKVYSPPPVTAVPVPPPAPPAPPLPRPDEWTGSFVVYTRTAKCEVTVNGRRVFDNGGAGTALGAPLTLRIGDVVAFHATAPGEVMRAAFLAADAKQAIALRASDLHDVAGCLSSTLDAARIDATKQTASAVSKIPTAEVAMWEQSGGHPVPRGGEYVTGKTPGAFSLGFVVTRASFRPTARSGRRADHLLFAFDDVPRTAAYWKWKANFTMSSDGAHGPAEADNELVSRFELEGDFAVDLDADFGQAAYTNTGGMLINVCGTDIGFDGGWNFGSWGGTTARVRVQRVGDELQLIRQDWTLLLPVPEAERGRPTRWRLWWRSRSSHVREIKVSADQFLQLPS